MEEQVASGIINSTPSLEINRELLEEIYKMDDPNLKASKMFDFWQAFIENQNEYTINLLDIKYFEKFTHLTVTLSGSFNEGVDIPEACLVRGENKEFLLSASGEEIDCTVNIKELTVSERAEGGGIKMEKVDKYPGFVRLRVEGCQEIETWAPLSNIACEELGRIREVYISPVAFTDEWYMMLLCKNLLLNLRYQVPGSRSPFEDERFDRKNVFLITNQEGPAIKTTVFAGVNRFQIDTAISIKCDEWPSSAKEWLQRVRPSNWPPARLLKECEELLGACVVPKYPHDSTTLLEWRISFVDVEGALMRSLTRARRACYRVFKGIWRIGLRAPANRYVQSYHIKTIFLWYCEQTNRAEFTEALLVPRVFDLLERLRECLLARDCPHYFIPANNLFQNISEQVIVKTLRNVNISIEKAGDIWIDNRGLFLLPCTTLTRVSMSMEMTTMFTTSVKRLFASLLDIGSKINQQDSNDGGCDCEENADDRESSVSESETQDSDDDDRDVVSDNDSSNLDINRNKMVFWDETAKIMMEVFEMQENDGDEGDAVTLLEIIYQATVNNKILHDAMFKYLCTRITPHDIMLLVRRKQFEVINIYSEILSYIGSYGDILQSLMDRKKRDYDD